MRVKQDDGAFPSCLSQGWLVHFYSKRKSFIDQLFGKVSKRQNGEMQRRSVKWKTSTKSHSFKSAPIPGLIVRWKSSKLSYYCHKIRHFRRFDLEGKRIGFTFRHAVITAFGENLITIVGKLFYIHCIMKSMNEKCICNDMYM